MRVLAGDIGGTNARLAIVDMDADAARVLYKRRFASKDSSALAPIVRAFLAEVADTPSRACFAIACPVISGTCSATNLSWPVDARALAAEIGIARTEGRLSDVLGRVPDNVIVNPDVGLIGAAVVAMRL